MKYLPLYILTFLLTLQLHAQEFNFDPQQGNVVFEFDNQELYKLQLDETSGVVHTNQTFYYYDGNDYRQLLHFGFDDKNGVGKIDLFDKNENASIQIDANQILVRPEGEITFSISGHRILGRNANGQETIRIDANRNNDGRITTQELELTGGSDLSEHFDLENDAEEIEASMVVSIADATGQLAISSTKRDKKIVGVISGANGIETGLLMGQKGSIADGDYPVALTGRTYVYANTENGPIEAGDFLTSSSTPGYAMKVKKFKKAQGAIIGKAMTELEIGEGFVLVLVNLQ